MSRKAVSYSMVTPPADVGIYTPTKKRQLTIYVSDELRKKIRIHCAEEDISYTEFISELVEAKLGECTKA